MKKILAVVLALVMCMSFAACGGDEISDIQVNGNSVSVTDFLIEHLSEYINTEEFAAREAKFIEVFDGAQPRPFAVNKVIELKADGLEAEQVSVHYLIVIADCDYALDESSGSDRLVLVVDFATGEVCDPFMVEESWINEPSNSNNYWYFLFHNGPVCSADYNGGTILIDSETRTELSEEEIAKINEAIHK